MNTTAPGTAEIEIALIHRACDACGGNDLEKVWFHHSRAAKASASYIFHNQVVICRKCGFAFASPCPAPEALRRYYADSLAGYKGIGLAYQPEARLALIKRYAGPNSIFVEIGGDRTDIFHEKITPFFKRVLNIELSQESVSDYASPGDVPEALADVLGHYDVLEHVPDLENFLKACHRILKNNGIMICEVPNVRLYPRNLLLMESEHVNHFSSATLEAVARRHGFRLEEISHLCSRPYGFVSVFRKTDKKFLEADRIPNDYGDTLACLKGGVAQIEHVIQHINRLKKKIAACGKVREKVTLWGVTDFLRQLVDNFSLPDSVKIVDSDPRKKAHWRREGLDVYEPKEMIGHIRESALMVIFAPRYKTEIIKWVEEKAGRCFNGSEVDVVGSGIGGESLL